ncbi:MAG: asparagine synthase (glutamine-hydrolyzing) [Mucilaginibacter sp.]
MCRIAGIISEKLSPDEIRENVAVMCNAMKHGGPDDYGIYADEQAGIVLGHRRLSIIDLSDKGHQPMPDVGKRAWISFNGEIYNYRELKEELIKTGAVFLSDTDTEVILAAYLQWGTRAFSRLRGMFAFALYDADRSVTYLVRDSAGIKPLYYYATADGIVFASELKAFKAAGIATRSDSSWRVKFLAFGNIPEPYTTLANVVSLAKGHMLSWCHKSSTYNLAPYGIASATANDYIEDANIAKTRINNAFKIAVSRQLISDASIGVFLSGGIDSSLLSLVASELHPYLQTVSIYFNEKQYDERLYQKKVQSRLSGKCFTHLVQQQDFESFFPHFLSGMDLPTTDGINTWFISKYAHDDGLKAVLSGLGADELFGGYPSFNRIEYLKYLRRLPKFVLKGARYFKTDKYRKVSFLTHNHPLADYLLLRGLFVPEDIARILDTDEEQVNRILFGDQVIEVLNSYNKEHAAWFETNLYLQNQLLRDTDVLSMAHGLEVRVPFLDEDFRQLVQNISPGIRFNAYQPKKILLDSFSQLLPEAIWKRPKMGFTFPLQEWMRTHSEISDKNLYKGEFAQNLVKSFKEGRLHWSKIFALYQIQLND